MSSRLPFLELVNRRVVVLDGAMGSNLQVREFDLKRDWLGHENISEVLNFTRPDVIQQIHEEFLAVGCDAVETNTFGANEIVKDNLAEMREAMTRRNKPVRRLPEGAAPPEQREPAEAPKKG